jgi:hypothetical protein
MKSIESSEDPYNYGIYSDKRMPINLRPQNSRAQNGSIEFNSIQSEEARNASRESFMSIVFRGNRDTHR